MGYKLFLPNLDMLSDCVMPLFSFIQSINRSPFLKNAWTRACSFLGKISQKWLAIACFGLRELPYNKLALVTYCFAKTEHFGT